MENPIKMDDLEETRFFGNTHIYVYIYIYNYIYFWIDQMFSLLYDEWNVKVHSDR